MIPHLRKFKITSRKPLNQQIQLTLIPEDQNQSFIVFLGEDDERQYLYPEEFHEGFFRLSVGIEDVEDIIEDIHQALEKIGFSS